MPLFSAAAVAFILLFPVIPVHSQTFPSKPIRIVVPAAPGGGASIVARIIGDHLFASLGQPVVVDSRPGTGGVIGTDIVAKSAPDGHTLLMGFSGSVTIVPALYKKLPYRPLEDFSPVSLAVSSPLIMLVHSSVPAKSVRDLVTLAHSRPSQLNYSSAGNGTSSHLAAELFKKTAKVEITHVPYKGATQALMDAVAGEVSVHFSGIMIALPHVQSGRLRALGLTSIKRLPSLPDMITVAESGLPGYEVDTWQGLLYPAGIPAPILNKVQKEIMHALATPDVRQRLIAQGVEPVGGTPKEFAEVIARDMAKWRKLVADTDMRID